MKSWNHATRRKWKFQNMEQTVHVVYVVICLNTGDIVQFMSFPYWICLSAIYPWKHAMPPCVISVLFVTMLSSLSEVSAPPSPQLHQFCHLQIMLTTTLKLWMSSSLFNSMYHLKLVEQLRVLSAFLLLSEEDPKQAAMRFEFVQSLFLLPIHMFLIFYLYGPLMIYFQQIF